MLSVILIGFCSCWAKPPWLAWLDTRVWYTYQIVGINEQEEQYILAPEFFAPYEEKAFIMIPFNYLVTDHAVLVGPFGVSQSIEKTDALEQVTTAEQLFEL